MPTNQEAIAFAIKRIQLAGGESNHATFVADERRNIYIQFLTDRGGDVVEGELTANRFLPPNWQLSDEQHEILENHGWELTDFNWVKSWDVADDDDRDDVAQQAVHILSKAYKVPPSRPLRREMRLEPDHHPHPGGDHRPARGGALVRQHRVRGGRAARRACDARRGAHPGGRRRRA